MRQGKKYKINKKINSIKEKNYFYIRCIKKFLT